jgi:hypothetical protein
MPSKFHHVVCGVRSNIPECCIKFWLTKWTRMTPERKRVYRLKSKSHSGQYIPCPKCVAKNRVADITHCVGLFAPCYLQPVCFEGDNDAATFKFRNTDEKNKVKRILQYISKEEGEEGHKGGR